MKKVFLLILPIFLSFTLFSQDFEGVISWKMQSSMPKQAAMPQNANADMSNAREELMKQLKNPEVANNPQAKEMLEKMLAQMPSSDAPSGANPMDNMMPKGMIIKIKGGNTLVSLEGGMAASMMGYILTLKGKPESYAIKKDKKTYSVLPKSNQKTNEAALLVTKTTETMKILGYDCVKFIITNPKAKTPETQFIYATTQIKDIDSKLFKDVKAGQDDKFGAAMSKVDGVPLRMEVKSDDVSITMECTKIERKKLNIAEFTIPKDFKETKMFGF
ncbi:MAG: DUF4412 domain-containing protein [Bacteroidetes bacterium]|nr:MAG: DUF4412 domain-containing protein [Bacteroidota bacterium]